MTIAALQVLIERSLGVKDPGRQQAVLEMINFLVRGRLGFGFGSIFPSGEVGQEHSGECQERGDFLHKAGGHTSAAFEPSRRKHLAVRQQRFFYLSFAASRECLLSICVICGLDQS